MLLNVLNTSSFADEARPSQPGASARQHVTLIQFMKYFKDLDNDITTESDAHQENGTLLESTSRDWQHWQHSILVGASCP